MRAEAARAVTPLAMTLGVLLLCGCATRVGTEADAGAERGTGTADTEPAAVAAPAGPSAPVEEATEADDVISQVLAERRRGDYPEIEVLESGFTITEQVQIRGDVRTDYEQALSLMRRERYEEGIRTLRDVIASTPDATAPYIDLAIAYRHIGDLTMAEESLTTAALLSPDNPVVHNELGIVYRRTGRFTQARASYEQALTVFSSFHYARRNLAVLCDLYLADLDCALRNYRAYLDSAGGDPEVEIWVADLENRLATEED